MENSNTEKKRSAFSKMWRFIPLQFKIGIVLVAIVIAAIFIFLGRFDLGNNSLGFVTDDKIDITPTQIESIKSIGQWEFLAVADEEMVDTVRKGLISDDELVRIYYGTVRLGIDLQEVKDDWIKVEGKTVNVVLPPIKLLDDEFIDEAKTRPFIERGKWTDMDRAAMYDMANRKMKAKCLTKENLNIARENAVAQFTSLMYSMGFKDVKVTFEDKAKK